MKLLALNAPRVVEPLELRRAVRRISAVAAVARDPRGAVHQVAAEKLVRHQLASAEPLNAPAMLVPSLMDLLAHSTRPEVRRAIVSLLVHADSISWRRLWVVWQTAAEGAAVIPTLAERIAQRARISKRFCSNLPAWLPITDAVQVEAALRQPEPLVLAYFERAQISLVDWPAGTELSESGGIGRGCLLHLARHGSDGWWRLASPTQLRTWVEQKQSLALSGILADRQLLAAYPHAKGPMEVRPRDPDLQVWVMRNLGDPLHHPGKWEGVSSRARQLFMWMLLADECQKIFAEFRKGADDVDRADYWERSLPYIVDARFYRAKDIAVCLMRLGDVLVIEFGNNGHACFFYQFPSSAPPLRALKLPASLRPDAFKDTHALVLGSVVFPHLRRLTHRGDWQTNFDNARVFRR